MTAPYHPEYGPVNSERIAAIRIARVSGVRRAAELTGWGRSTIYRWLHDLDPVVDKNP